MYLVAYDGGQYKEVHECKKQSEALNVVQDISADSCDEGTIYLAKIIAVWRDGKYELVSD